MSADKPNEADRLRNLDARAAEQRRSLFSSLDQAGERLRPASLGRDAGNYMLDLGLDGIERVRSAVRRNPLKMLGIGAAITALVAWRPLTRLGAKGLSSGIRQVRSAWPGRKAPQDNEDGHGQEN